MEFPAVLRVSLLYPLVWDAAFWLTVGSFLLTVKLFVTYSWQILLFYIYLQLELLCLQFSLLCLHQGAAKGVRQKEFDHFFSFSGRFRSLFGHFF